MVFMFCLYCNVSDVWMLFSKWRWIVIVVVGMYVELFFFVVVVFVWWFIMLGLFNYLCLNVLFISLFMMIVFNVNFLMWYDGYYIFFDMVEIFNLC